MKENQLHLVSPFSPNGDQPQAIEKLTEGLRDGLAAQTLLGVTGSGKTFTIANVIQKGYKLGERVLRPARVNVYEYKGSTQ